MNDLGMYYIETSFYSLALLARGYSRPNTIPDPSTPTPFILKYPYSEKLREGVT